MSPLVRRELGGVNTRAWEHPKGRGSMPRAVGHPKASTSVTLRNTGGQTVVLHRVCPRAPRCERRRASAEGCVVLLRVPVQVRYPRAPRCERRRASAEGCVCVCPCSASALVSLDRESYIAYRFIARSPSSPHRQWISRSASGLASARALPLPSRRVGLIQPLPSLRDRISSAESKGWFYRLSLGHLFQCQLRFLSRSSSWCWRRQLRQMACRRLPISPPS